MNIVFLLEFSRLLEPTRKSNLMQEIILNEKFPTGAKLYIISVDQVGSDLVAYILTPPKFQHPNILPQYIKTNNTICIGEQTVNRMVLTAQEIEFACQELQIGLNKKHEIVKYFLSDDAGILFGLRNPCNLGAAISYRRGELKKLNSKLIPHDPNKEHCTICLESFDIVEALSYPR